MCEDPEWFAESPLAAELALRLFCLPRLLEVHLFDAQGRAGERLAFLPGVSCSFPVQRLLATGRDVEVLWNGLSPRCRNKIRRAGRMGVEVTRVPGVNAGIALLSRLRDQVQAERGLDVGLSDALLTRLAPSLHEGTTRFRVDVWCATLPGAPEPVAALLNLAAPGRIQNHAALATVSGRRVAAHNALHWAAIEDAAGRGCGVYDFGLSEGLPGVEAFKASFGAVPVQMRAWRRTHPLLRPMQRLRRTVVELARAEQ
jgi:hypothetical protein